MFAKAETYQSEKVSVNVNKEQLNEPKPLLIESKTYVPMYTFFKTLGFEVDWNPKDQTARIIDRNTGTFGLSFLVDTNQIPLFYMPQKNADPFISIAILDDTPILINDDVYIPLRSFCEIFAGDIQWNEDERKVIVNVNTNDFSKIWKALESHETKEGNQSKSIKMTQKSIPGMVPLDIKQNLEKTFSLNFRQAKFLNGGERYPSEFLISGSSSATETGITLKCDLYGNLPEHVRLIALSVTGDSKEEVNKIALEYFASVATTPYDGSNIQAAKKWVENNTLNKGEIRDTMIGNISFEISGGPNFRLLLIASPPENK